MAKQVDLMQGTLEMLILKAVSLGKLHGYGVLLRIQQISGSSSSSSRDRSTRHCTAWSMRGRSPANGVRARTTAAPSTTPSRLPAETACLRG